MWWCMPLIIALKRQKHVDVYEFKTNLVYMASSRSTRAPSETLCLNKNRHIVLVRVVITVMPLGEKMTNWLMLPQHSSL